MELKQSFKQITVGTNNMVQLVRVKKLEDLSVTMHIRRHNGP